MHTLGNKKYFLVGAVLVIACIMIIIEYGIDLPSNETIRGVTGNECDLPNLTLLDVYTAPLGGFNKSEYTGVMPNSSFETEYIFYSRSYGPGNVSIAKRTTGDVRVTIDPSEFFVEPDHTYHSQVLVTTGPGFDTKYISLRAILETKTPHFADDEMTIYPDMPPGLLWVHQDHVSVENNEIIVKKNDCQWYNITYHRGLTSGIGTISYNISETPLNVTIIPSRFISKPGVANPSKIILHANSATPPGIYPVNISVHGGSEWLYVNKEDQSRISILYSSDEKVIPLRIRVA